ncbi:MULTISPECIES: secondary thiamine-phosphate synthase enzyme YjbQ [Prochlorococcus]|uniref:secondary thiamine-phosphate synthase enzyme YjbQ n=1 Tax=Prochlorococcus TaxID=1218 RepID=UPI000533BDA4|nr:MULTISPECIES: secondary thiamine-phosphate synthase enzyme YjbQ [Prochlorococcus]KGG12900.1 hypothetical protein EV05_0573 [Prochlorococcus sp. MIT 0601]
MDQIFSEITFKTNGEGFLNITPKINEWIIKNKINQAILVLSIQHTSCSLTINENADPKVLKDLSSYMKAIVPEKEFTSLNKTSLKQEYLHSEEGIDDMPAHIKTALTCTCLSLSINDSKLVLGTWQAIYLWEHRYANNFRKVSLHAVGEIAKVESRPKSESLNQILVKTNPEKINKEVIKRDNPEQTNQDGEIETKLDLLIDRMHDLTSQKNQPT